MISTLLTATSMGLSTAFAHYFVKMVMFVIAAAAGIFIGIKIKQRKDAKNNIDSNKDKE